MIQAQIAVSMVRQSRQQHVKIGAVPLGRLPEDAPVASDSSRSSPAYCGQAAMG